ncbi:MAG TPA: hypothetical protein PKO45_09150 [Rubrivivax sp.]|nr:hypothetical protein [Burkholderiales bacterium]HNT39273.1 hypothetical protein [Rubrivivax sp.]
MPGADLAERDQRLATLLAAAARGDTTAFEAFYDATYAYARTVARRVLAGGDTDDLLADAYFEAWRKAASFDAALDAALDTDLVAELDALLEPADEATIARECDRVRHPLLRRIAVDSTERHLTLPAGSAGWQPFGAGLAIKVLHEAGSVMSYRLRLDAGGALVFLRGAVPEAAQLV